VLAAKAVVAVSSCTDNDGSQNGRTAKDECIDERIIKESMDATKEALVPFLKFETAEGGSNLLIGLVLVLGSLDVTVPSTDRPDQTRRIIELAYLGKFDQLTKM
jgi:hypothetical protein